MKASYRWLRELSKVDLSPPEMAETLTQAGLEVDSMRACGVDLDHVVVAEVRKVAPVPERNKLSSVVVFDGESERHVVCGAPNVPSPGGRVALARPGARLAGGLEIAERKVGGVLSSGMLASEDELAIGGEKSGILVLGATDRGRPGEKLADALRLEDWVLDIGVTPNRPDCLGHMGLARELAVAAGRPFSPPPVGSPRSILAESDAAAESATGIPLGVEAPGGQETLTLVDADPAFPVHVPVDIQDATRCPRYAAGVLHHVHVGTSPFWLRNRLFVLGIRSIDCVVDATNLVLLEYGHPIHAFDLSKAQGGRVVVRRARGGETLATLDGVDRPLTDDDLLICDAKHPLAVAGIMGGANSEVRSTTRAVLLEVAYFEPRGVRRTSRRLGLHTEASHRFERGVDPNAIPHVMKRAMSLIASLSSAGARSTAVDAYPLPQPSRQVGFSVGRASEVLGMELGQTECRRALEGLGFAIAPGEAQDWRVTVPTYRPDISRCEDLIEEVARIKGYDEVPHRLPPGLPGQRGWSRPGRLVRTIRRTASAQGLLETVNYAFVSGRDLERSRVSTDAVRLLNPLSDERDVMRTSLLPGLLANARRAERHQVRQTRLFEIARCFRPGAERLPVETNVLAVLMAGPRAAWVGDASAVDFYDVKGVLLSIVEQATGLELESVIDQALDGDAAYLHPSRRGRLVWQGESMGVLGEVHPDVTDTYGLVARAVYGEVDLDTLVRVALRRGAPQAVPLPRYPAVQRDLALVVDESRSSAEVVRVLLEAGQPLLEAVDIFDVYRGEPIPAGKRSLAYRLVYRDPDATLTDKRVDTLHKRVTDAARIKLDAQVRD